MLVDFDKPSSLCLAIIGLGYVGLPLAVEFSKKRPVIGFDLNQSRVTDLINGKDITNEVSREELIGAKGLKFTTSAKEMENCNCFIITVPTPVDRYKNPDLGPLVRASEIVGGLLKVGGIVIYESTVYPGATEEECVPVLERCSGLKFNIDFFVGYSPERINPGDKEHRLPMIKKVTSGSNPFIANVVDSLYKEIIVAGTHKAPSIKVAEAAKVIENTQRDINIALVNELALIFNRLGIDTEDVLVAAGSKWNFLPFRPGLVGGHCIGVDPYYLTHKAKAVGYRPEIILAGRRLNDGMGTYVASQLIKLLIKKSIQIEGANILILGLAFKENCRDIRNSQVINIIHELADYGCNAQVYDPCVLSDDAMREYNIELLTSLKNNTYDAVILAVAHIQFKEMGIDKIRALGKHRHVFYDLKYVFNSKESDLRL
jgi:UDP-N-acetyl-D-galactosamine dehydrogenase